MKFSGAQRRMAPYREYLHLGDAQAFEAATTKAIETGSGLHTTCRIRLKTGEDRATVSACPQASFRPPCSLALPALNTAFETARTRAGASEKHPPQMIYVVLRLA
jgi:hypothetical protein